MEGSKRRVQAVLQSTACTHYGIEANNLRQFFTEAEWLSVS